jgi:pimeloyl-ACP methyl ester carboxylesterase
MSQERHHVILVPGLRDGQQPLLKLVLLNWRLNDLAAELHLAPWTDVKEKLDDKLARLVSLVESYQADKVSLVGISAGGSLVLNAFIKRPKLVSHVVTVCAPIRVILGQKPKGDALLEANPALRASLESCERGIGQLSAKDKHQVLTIRSAHDQLIADQAVLLDGATNIKISGFNHTLGIFTAFVVENKRILDFIKDE